MHTELVSKIIYCYSLTQNSCWSLKSVHYLCTLKCAVSDVKCSHVIDSEASGLLRVTWVALRASVWFSIW